METGLLDSPIVRAHPCAAGAQTSGGQAQQVLGRSRSGFSTKLHITADNLGNPLRHRRVFSRFDKLASRYLGFLHFVSALIWLR